MAALAKLGPMNKDLDPRGRSELDHWDAREEIGTWRLGHVLGDAIDRHVHRNFQRTACSGRLR
jgi:hypothetical protein